MCPFIQVLVNGELLQETPIGPMFDDQIHGVPVKFPNNQTNDVRDGQRCHETGTYSFGDVWWY